MSKVERKLLFRDLFQGIELDKLKIPDTLEIPDDYYQHLLDYSMERSYLNHISEREDFADLPYETGRISASGKYKGI